MENDRITEIKRGLNNGTFNKSFSEVYWDNQKMIDDYCVSVLAHIFYRLENGYKFGELKLEFNKRINPNYLKDHVIKYVKTQFKFDLVSGVITAKEIDSSLSFNWNITNLPLPKKTKVN